MKEFLNLIIPILASVFITVPIAVQFKWDNASTGMFTMGLSLILCRLIG